MSLIEKFKKSFSSSSIQQEQNALPPGQGEQRQAFGAMHDQPMSLEDAWFALCDNPNHEKLMQQVLSAAQARAGQAGKIAALKELSTNHESWLAPARLGRAYLEEHDVQSAIHWYKEALERNVALERALFDVTADMGKNKMAGAMPELVLPYYRPDAHNIFIGINILQAYRESGRLDEGRKMVRAILPYVTLEAKDHIERLRDFFERVRTVQNPAPKVAKPQPAPDVRTPPIIYEAIHPTLPQQEQAPPIKQAVKTKGFSAKILEPKGHLRIKRPLWSNLVPGLDAMIPTAKSSEAKRVGMMLLFNANGEDNVIQKPWEDKQAALCCGLPALLHEYLLFSKKSRPVVVYPYDSEKGLVARPPEANQNAFISLCEKEDVEAMLVGSIEKANEGYLGSFWIFEKEKRSVRMASKTLASDCKEVFELIEELAQMLCDKPMPPPTPQSQVAFSWPAKDRMLDHLKALSAHVFLELSDREFIVPELEPKGEPLLSTSAQIADSEFCGERDYLYLLRAMRRNKAKGGKEYLNYKARLDACAARQASAAAIRATSALANTLFAGHVTPG